MKRNTRPIEELLTERTHAAAELSDARNRVAHLERLLDRYDKDLKAAGYTPVEPKLHFDDMGGLSYVEGAGIRHGSMFLLILKRVQKWMSDEELIQRAKFIGMKQNQAGDFLRSLQRLSGIRRRKSDGYIGLREWPDSKS